MTRNAVPDLQAGAIRSFSCAMSVATSGLNGASGPDWLLKVLRRLTPTGRDLHLPARLFDLQSGSRVH